MSGIYIPGMEMPKDGSFEVLVVHDNGIVAKGFFPNENEFTNAIFIPDHGRLIDADALKESIKEARKAQPEIADVYDDDYFFVAEWLASASTIIPAESEGE